MADDKLVLSSELLRALDFTGDMPRGAVLERVRIDTLRFSRQLVGLLLFAVEFGDVTSVEQLADQAQARLDKINAQVEAAQDALQLGGKLLADTHDEARRTMAAAEEEAHRHKADADDYVTQQRGVADDLVAKARADAERVITLAVADAAAHVEHVHTEHAGLEAAIVTKKAEHDELERRIGEHRETLASLRRQLSKLMVE